ncbi:oxysterol-binding protein [Anaeramoeba flamelloides]|uniref:Oxysterol-binding protein n=1 Tax=Anaeramoeba flamelloides TaxID=1746091 RepID=A0ABQ8YF91_9EUKA|nr:oxysterol-binding protein [Anaeramoeba flamelloides]
MSKVSKKTSTKHTKKEKETKTKSKSKSKKKEKKTKKTKKKEIKETNKLVLNVEEARQVNAPDLDEIKSFVYKDIVIRSSPVAQISLKKKKKFKDDWDRVHYAHPNGGWLYRNKSIIKRQRKIVWEIIKNMAGNIFKNERDLSTITMPVTIFEPRSYLHRLVDIFQFAPIFLRQAALAKDPIERMKFVICFAVAGIHNTVAQAKPFNPILGETFQGTFVDGTKIYCEQICHHPPISAFEIIEKNDLYHLHGKGQFKSTFKGYSVSGRSEGDVTIDFSDGGRIVFSTPMLHLKGIIFGDRIVEYTSTAPFRDESNNLYCELTFNPDPRGWIKSVFTSSNSNPTDYFHGEIMKKATKNQKEEKICEVNGSWLGRIDFDDLTYFSLNDGWHPVTVYECDEVLPSDCKNRQDLNQLKLGNLKESGKEKHKLEVLQRKDAKLRKKATKKSKKNQKQKKKSKK